MFPLRNGKHGNTITESDCFNAHKTNKKVLPKSYKMRHHF